MSDRSPIEWTDATWNPVRGCTKVSPGCKFCYAELCAERFRGVPGHPFEQGVDLRLVPEKLDQPLHWRRPRKIFVNSMSDLFHEDGPPDYIARVGDVMRRADWHVFQVLTKRDERLRELLRGGLRWMTDLEHVAFGVSVEDRQYGLPRVRSLQDTPARIRFLSVEPLLADLGLLDLRGIDWVIVGGENVRSDRTRAGMRAALELGRWTFLAPIGYLNAPRSTGKSFGYGVRDNLAISNRSISEDLMSASRRFCRAVCRTRHRAGATIRSSRCAASVRCDPAGVD